MLALMSYELQENGDMEKVDTDGDRVFSEDLRSHCRNALQPTSPLRSSLLLELAILSTQEHPSHQAQFWLGKLAPPDIIEEVTLLISLARGFDAGTEFLRIVGCATEKIA